MTPTASADPKRPPHPTELQRLEWLRALTAIRCRRLTCSRKVCRRSGQSRMLARIERLAPRDGQIDNATSWRIINELRVLLGRKPLRKG